MFVLSFCSISSNQFLRPHHHFWAAALKSWNSPCHIENERQQLSEPAFDAFNLFPGTKRKRQKKKHACKMYNWEDSSFLKLRILSSYEIAVLPSKLFCTKSYLFYFFCSQRNMFNISNGTETRQPENFWI